MMLPSWARGLTGTPRESNYQRALDLTDEVITAFRERAASPDPLRAVMADLFLQHHDVALVAEAFEVSQEAKIYKGPEP